MGRARDIALDRSSGAPWPNERYPVPVPISKLLPARLKTSRADGSSTDGPTASGKCGAFEARLLVEDPAAPAYRHPTSCPPPPRLSVRQEERATPRTIHSRTP